MRLLDDWKWIVRHAWSIRLIILAAVLSGIEVYFQIFGSPTWMPLGVFAALSSIVSGGAFVARLYAQPIVVEDPYNADQ